jgi:hypothetical protein
VLLIVFSFKAGLLYVQYVPSFACCFSNRSMESGYGLVLEHSFLGPRAVGASVLGKLFRAYIQTVPRYISRLLAILVRFDP